MDRRVEMTSSRRAREWAVQMLTAADLNPAGSPEETITAFWGQLGSLEPEYGLETSSGDAYARKFAEQIVLGVLGSLQAIDKTVSELLDGWDFLRLGTVERAVLRIGVWEIMNSRTPLPVIINESVDLVNWFSTPKSRPLVNAVLDRFAKSRAGGR